MLMFAILLDGVDVVDVVGDVAMAGASGAKRTGSGQLRGGAFMLVRPCGSSRAWRGYGRLIGGSPAAMSSRRGVNLCDSRIKVTRMRWAPPAMRAWVSVSAKRTGGMEVIRYVCIGIWSSSTSNQAHWVLPCPDHQTQSTGGRGRNSSLVPRQEEDISRLPRRPRHAAGRPTAAIGARSRKLRRLRRRPTRFPAALGFLGRVVVENLSLELSVDAGSNPVSPPGGPPAITVRVRRSGSAASFRQWRCRSWRALAGDKEPVRGRSRCGWA